MYRVAQVPFNIGRTHIFTPIVLTAKALVTPIVKSNAMILITNFPIVLAAGTFFLAPGIVAANDSSILEAEGFPPYQSQSFGRIKYSGHFWKKLILEYPGHSPLKLGTYYSKGKIAWKIIKKIGQIILEGIAWDSIKVGFGKAKGENNQSEEVEEKESPEKTNNPPKNKDKEDPKPPQEGEKK